MHKPSIILTLLIIFSIPAWGISHNFTHLTIKEGLSQSTIKSIHQDYKGFIWFGSADGLNKYDAYTFTIYRNNPADNRSICGNDISCIYEDPADSTLWIGTQSDGLNRYCRTTDSFTQFRKGKTGSIPSNGITAIVREPGGKLWFAIAGCGLHYFNPIDSSFNQPPFAKDPNLQNINTLAFDQRGGIWMGTPEGLYWTTTAKSNNFDHSTTARLITTTPKQPHVTALLIDRRGNLWIGTLRDGLLRYQPESQALTQYLQEKTGDRTTPPATIRCLTQRRNGDIWIGTEQGLYQHTPSDKLFIHYANDPTDNGSINDDVVFSLFEDRSGILWMGTYFGGINKLDPDESRFNRFNNLHKLFGLNRAANNVKSLFRDHENTIWVCTNKGLIAFDGRANNVKNGATPAARLFFKEIDQHMIFGDSKNNLYLSNEKGVFIRKNNSDFIPFQPNRQLGAIVPGTLTHAFEDSDKTVWFLSANGIFKYTPHNNQLELIHPIGELLLTGNDYFMTGMEGSDGKIWLGTVHGKLFQYNKNTNQIVEIKPANLATETKPYNRIFSICEQAQGVIWYGTNNGLYRYLVADNTVKRYMDSDGLANNVVYATLTDKRKRIWCSTNYGISVFNPENQTFTNYTWEDGLQSNEFNQSAYHKSVDGTIYMGGIEGFNIIEPEKITPNEFIPPVVFTALAIYHEWVSPFSHPKITNRHIAETNALTLTHKQAIVTIEFAALNYIHANKNQYRYKLEGYDTEWINSGTSRKATYTNISPGQYTFMVQGSNNNGIWNNESTSMKITILPPFWLTWWFKTMMVLLVAATIYLIFSFRLRTIKRKAQLLKQLVQEKTADLSEKNMQIEAQNQELIRINEQINLHNHKIEEKNQQLNQQNQQIAQQRDNLIQLSNELNQANQAKINFFTNISHEFRTPLTLIIGPLKELLNNIETASQAELLRKFKIVYGNASKLLMLVNQLLDFRKADTNNLTLQYSKLDIVDFARQTAFLFNDMAKRKKIDFKFTATFAKLEICFDQDKMEKILFNLLSNAFKFTPANGEIILKLDLDKSGSSQNLCLSVSDTGRGIAKEEQEAIFEPFFQSNQQEKQQESGSGIGLALVKKYTELHHGSIHVSSRPGSGSTFVVQIPVVETCDQLSTASSSQPILSTDE